jgi:choline dehydrogenase-like flavoprotein
MNTARELGYNWNKLDKFMFQDRFDPNQHPAHFFYGDPRNVKWGARFFIEEALQNGATLINQAKVKKVIIENGKATGVEFSKWGAKHTVFAPKIVVAAGGIGSPIILKNSGIIKAGVDFFFDPLISVAGYIDGIESKPEIPMSAGVHFSKEGYMMTDMNLPKFLDMIFTLSAFRLHRTFSHKKAVRIMIKIRDDLGGRLGKRGGIWKNLSKNDEEKFKSGYKRAKEILKKAGAREVFTTWRLASHPGGTVKIGECVDSNLKTEYDNLYVCDCSVVPEPWGLPPTLTILGLARRLSNHLLDQGS